MKFIKALSVFLGTVIGAGIFGLPFVALRAGFFIVVLYFLIMAAVIVLTYFLYGEVILGTEKLHRLPGYVEEYLGKKWKRITFLVTIIGLGGALLAYLILGGQFLNFLFNPYFGGNPILYTFLFFALGAYLVFRGIKSISPVELSLLVVFVIILFIFFIKALPLINVDYLKTLDLKFLIYPYGVILFSLGGSAVIPEIKEMLIASPGKSQKVEARKSLRKVISLGTIIAVITYLFFIFIVLGVCGPNTSKEAISGLRQILGSNIIKLGFAFGVIACFTSFLTIALTLKKVFWYDFGFPKNLAWFITCFLPLILFLLGLREFIEVIGFSGALGMGAEAIIIVFLYRKFLKKKFSKNMNPGFYLLTGIFVLGIIFGIIHFLFV